MSRASGVLVHPTSFPGRFGIGDLGPEAYRFVDWLAGAGQKWWQVLPLNPIDAGNSPYQSPSAFAGNPLLVSPEAMYDDGLVTEEDLRAAEIESNPDQPRANYDLARERKRPLWAKAEQTFRELPEDHPLQQEFRAFATSQAGWLNDTALFMALKDANEGRSWTTWNSYVDHRHYADAEARTVLGERIFHYRFQQFLFARQWNSLRSYAAAKGVKILGDAPIYVAQDSSDVWSNRRFFQLDEAGHPRQVAGVPPDYFSSTGQLWNNPLYDWAAMDQDEYRWWIARLRAVLQSVDIVRLDHFRGFEAYWSVPAGHKTAELGMWVPGPRDRLFRAIRDALCTEEDRRLPILAEDLGTITEEVDALRKKFHLPGMKVLQFMILSDEGFRPHEFEAESACYTGTHDNDTTRGWFHSDVAPYDYRMDRIRQFVSGNEDSFAWEMLQIAWRSSSDLAIAPLQDLLNLGSEARMNTPGTFSDDFGNWCWQYRPGVLTSDLQHRLRRMTEETGRS